jgi:hypothetical protein
MAKRLLKKTMTAALEALAETLSGEGVTHPVRVEFPKADGSPSCFEWRCFDEDGIRVCRWVKVC